jgi:hypothetical protein
MEELAVLVAMILREADALENAKAAGSEAATGMSSGKEVIHLQRRIS